MRIRLLQTVRIGKVFRGPGDGPLAVDDEVARRLVAEGKARGLDPALRAGPADKMFRGAARKEPLTPDSRPHAPDGGPQPAVCGLPSPELYCVIPTCGRPKDLDRTLSAIFFEPPDELHVIVVNDATDEHVAAQVRDVVERHTEKRRKVVCQDTGGDCGVTASRIRGNGQAPEGSVIVEIDDHDTPEPGALRLVAQAFSDPNVQAVYGDHYRVTESGALINRVSRGDYTPAKFLQDGNQATGIRAYRKRLYTAVGGRQPQELYASEYALFLKFEQYLGLTADRTPRTTGDGPRPSSVVHSPSSILHIAAPLCRCPVAASGVSIRHAPEQTAAADRYAYLAQAGAILPRECGDAPPSAPAPAPLQPVLMRRGVGVAAFPISSYNVSIIVPCYRSAAYVQALADSLASDRYEGARELIWVLDGDKPDDYPALPGNVVVRPENAGFAAACNTGARFAQGRFICLLNADTQVKPGWLDALTTVFDIYDDVGAAAPKTLNPDGAVNSLGSRFDYEKGSFTHITSCAEVLKVFPVDMATAACLLMPRTLWDALGGLDESYRLGYWEDTDLCMRIRRAGYDILVTPLAEIVHHEGHSALGQKHPFYQENRDRFHKRWVETGLVDKFMSKRNVSAHGNAEVAVCIIALNEAEYIGAAIESVYDLADRIIALEAGNEYSASFGWCRPDGTSLDGTMDVVRALHDPRNIIETYAPPDGRPFKDKTEARQFYLDMIEPGDWCLALDADEVFWQAGLWRLSALMHDYDYVRAELVSFWRDFNTVGAGRWRDWGLDCRFFRVAEGYRYRTHLEVVTADGVPIVNAPGVRRCHEREPVVAHYAWVKPLRKIRQKLEYYRRQCPGRVVFDDYVDRVFLADLDTANQLGSHPMGGGTCEPWARRHPLPIEDRMRRGLFAWIDPVMEAYHGR